uniref:Putative secreted protein n=1 Tax=Rhipicephalus microplus TaxID=6941 RepID=A0A6G5A357_RHIMP
MSDVRAAFVLFCLLADCGKVHCTKGCSHLSVSSCTVREARLSPRSRCCRDIMCLGSSPLPSHDCVRGKKNCGFLFLYVCTHAPPQC